MHVDQCDQSRIVELPGNRKRGFAMPGAFIRREARTSESVTAESNEDTAGRRTMSREGYYFRGSALQLQPVSIS
jgi:hypothetical protein